MQKIIFCGPVSHDYPEINFNTVNQALKDGWTVVSITPQHCSNTGGGDTSYTKDIYGGFAVLIEKDVLEI